MVQLKVTRRYTDKELGKEMEIGEMFEVTRERAEELMGVGIVKIVKLSKIKKKK